MSDLEKIINALSDAIESASGSFNSNIDVIQQSIYDDVSLLVKNLDITNGKIDNSVNNIKAIGALKSKIEKIILNPDYIDSVKEYTNAFGAVSKLQDSYFNQLSNVEGPKNLLSAIKQQSIEYTVSSLTESGIGANVTDGIRDILKRNITGNASYNDLLDQMRNFILTNESGTGALERYTKQITTDSLQQFSRQYGQVIASDLGMDWFMYVGSNRRTSREFCILLTKKRWIHRSELGDIVNGFIDGVKVKINPTTHLWSGAIAGTDENNIQVNCGGWGCEHSMYPISEDMVPGNIRMNFQKLTPSQQKEFDEIKRNDFTKTSDKHLEEQSIKQFVLNKSELIKDYISKHGNIVDTDKARKLFDGYNGINANAFHSAAAALGKVVKDYLLANGTNDRVVVLAGSSGSGKTTATLNLIPEVTNSADAIIDTNLSRYEDAIQKINEFLSMGKAVEFNYTYREPVDSWVNGVIKRMLEDETEMGRIVPLSVFMNTINSYYTISKMFKNGVNEWGSVSIQLIDNSLGKGNANFMSMDKFNSIEFPSDLKSILLEKTKQMFDANKITEEQYKELIQ